MLRKSSGMAPPGRALGYTNVASRLIARMWLPRATLLAATAVAAVHAFVQ